MNKSAHFWGWVLLFVSFVWGIEFSLVHQALNSMGPNTFNGVRFFIAVLTLFVYFGYAKHPWISYINLETLKHGVILGSMLFIGFATQSIGLQYTTASNAGFITGLNVVLVPIIAWLWLKQPQRWFVWLGVLLATIGTLLLTGGVDGFGKGELWILICAFGFAMHIVYTGVYVKDVDALTLTQIQLITVTIFSAIAALFWEFESVKNVPSILTDTSNLLPWLAILIGGILGTGLAYVAQTIGQQSLESWRVALIYSTEPLFAALGGYLILSDQLSAMAWLGALFIMAGMLIAELLDE